MAGQQMIAPIIIYNFGDVLIFETVEKAERYIEPIDIDNNEYIAYDSEGRLLRLIVRSRNRVHIEATEAEPNHADEVRKILIDFLAYVGLLRDRLLNATLQDLIVEGLKYKTE
jgi:hypothetical protein